MTRDDLAAVKHVQQMLIIDGKDYQGIKEAVFKYGGVQTSLYSTIASSKTKTPPACCPIEPPFFQGCPSW